MDVLDVFAVGRPRRDIGPALGAGAGGVELRTRSVGDDLTSAVLSRCSQSPMPRDSSRFT